MIMNHEFAITLQYPLAGAQKSTVKRIDGKEKLAFGRMFKTAILDSTKQLWLEQEVSETGTVDPDVAPAINVLA
jgi:hypothetical protein